MSQAPVYTSLANDGNEPLIAGAEKKRKRCNFKDCEKQAVKDGVCCKHGAKRKRKMCNFKDCEKWAVKGGVCVKHGADTEKRICISQGCEKWAVKDGVCCEHGAEKKLCNVKDCVKWVVKGGVCIEHGANRKDNAKEISKHIPIVADSLARIFARVGYAYARRITSDWENSSNNGNSGGNKFNPTFSMPNDLLGQVHTIRSFPHVLAEISEQSLRANCLRVSFERRLRSLYPCDDEEFGETTGNTSNDCITGPFCRPCLMHEHM